MFFNGSENNSVHAAGRSTALVGGLLVLFFIVSVVFFVLTGQWARRVLFFPEVSTRQFVAEIRYLPPAGNVTDDIRLLLEDILLGPSNFGNGPVLPVKTRLLSVMLEDDILYVGFSPDIYLVENTPIAPRAMLQAVANSVFFNFPWVKKVHFFINGKELSDSPLLDRPDNRLDFARILILRLDNLKETMHLLSVHPFAPSVISEHNTYLFQNGAQWDERLLK